MSPVAQALQARFSDVCRSELERLHKKTASLAPEQRAEVHALTLEVAERIAIQVSTRLASDDGSDLDAVVMRLFALKTGETEDR